MCFYRCGDTTVGIDATSSNTIGQVNSQTCKYSIGSCVIVSSVLDTASIRTLLEAGLYNIYFVVMHHLIISQLKWQGYSDICFCRENTRLLVVSTSE